LQTSFASVSSEVEASIDGRLIRPRSVFDEMEAALAAFLWERLLDVTPLLVKSRPLPTIGVSPLSPKADMGLCNA
jgi:hypothetical protein